MIRKFFVIGILIFVLSGAATGILAGLLGLGGGVISVPVIYYTLGFLGFPKEELMHTAVATSLAATMVTSFGASWSHHQMGSLRFDVLKPIVLGLLFGCVGGALTASFLSNDLLRYIFGSAVIPLGIYFFFPLLPSPNFAHGPNRSLIFWSVGIGCFSSLLGIGGGTLMLPVLLGYNLPMKNAIAVSSASTLTSAFFGTIVFLTLTYKQSSFPDTLGYIQIPAFLAIGFSSLLTTPIGTKLAHSLPSSGIKRIFACVLAITGIAMILGA